MSTRFGRNKLLERLGSDTLVGRVVSEARQAKAAQVIVVCGHESEKVRAVLSGHDCEFVVNEGFLNGQSSSVKTGLSRVRASVDAVMILPGDVAGVDHRIIDAVIDEYARSRAPIVTAAYGGRPGHPILFDRRLFGELEQIDEETRGLKKVVSKHLDESRLVETSPAAVLDVDTPEDLARLSKL